MPYSSEVQQPHRSLSAGAAHRVGQVAERGAYLFLAPALRHGSVVEQREERGGPPGRPAVEREAFAAFAAFATAMAADGLVFLRTRMLAGRCGPVRVVAVDGRVVAAIGPMEVRPDGAALNSVEIEDSWGLLWGLWRLKRTTGPVGVVRPVHRRGGAR